MRMRFAGGPDSASTGRSCATGLVYVLSFVRMLYQYDLPVDFDTAVTQSGGSGGSIAAARPGFTRKSSCSRCGEWWSFFECSGLNAVGMAVSCCVT